ncbi:uncharacterized protein LOC133187898 isoform X2 [Saccostrea echinata]|uniref:uncharacterized protein LOC133187898 isoform X2 n=1 Tax=Saccostrea echinata TaxID=191078 RepID=UPI002A818E8D|nr:uncharacterized protein LOC133187898 isoform X2 [Saccostrea echinata]
MIKVSTDDDVDTEQLDKVSDRKRRHSESESSEIYDLVSFKCSRSNTSDATEESRSSERAECSPLKVTCQCETGTDSLTTESEDSPDQIEIRHRKQTHKFSSIDLPPQLSNGEIENHEENEMIRELKKYVLKSPLMTRLKYLQHTYTSFSELSSEDLWEMAPHDDEKISFIPTWVPENHMIWFYRFHNEAHNFVSLLYLLLKRRENGCDLHESHLQTLFESFARMFGLNSWLSGVPWLDVETKQIMKSDVTGAADIIYASKMYSPFHDVKQGAQHPSVVAVCKVKKAGPQLDDKTSPQISKPRTKSKIKEISSMEVSSSSKSDIPALSEHKPEVCQHLDDGLIGQHGGELLFHFPETIKKEKIFGLIVQETQVTFTMLEMRMEQYNDIVEGKIKHKSEDRPNFKISRPYDYLNMEDREFIIEAFIKLAMMQRKIT